MTIAAIPTVYNGIRMRSRLEARWACMFDLLGWKWEYEPRDFHGWIPDFILHGDDRRVLYVEVKPVLQYPEHIASEINRSGCEDMALILGQTPFLSDEDPTFFGWMRNGHGQWMNAKPFISYYGDIWSERDKFRPQGDPVIDFATDDADGGLGFITGNHGGDGALCDTWGATAMRKLNPLWIQAGNVIQYKGGAHG